LASVRCPPGANHLEDPPPMRRLAQVPLVLLTIVALAACSASQTGGTPATSAQAPTPGASAAGGGGGAACAAAPAGATATVQVQIKDFKFSPQPVNAKVGDVVGWTNADSASHTATMDDGSCSTENLSQGATGLLVFNKAGTYTYHCKVHPTQMKDFTVVVS
jgi:plastocyanin